MLKKINKARMRCPVVLYEEIKAVFKKQKEPKKAKKTKKIPDLQSFYAISPNFQQTSSTGTLKKVRKERMCYILCLEKR